MFYTNPDCIQLRKIRADDYVAYIHGSFRILFPGVEADYIWQWFNADKY